MARPRHYSDARTGFASFEGWRDAILEQEESEQHKLGRKIAMEEDWLRYGVTARRTRNQRRLAELHALCRKRREYRSATGTARLDAAQADLSCRLVAAAGRVSQAFGDQTLARDTGAIRLGTNLAPITIGQRREGLDPKWTLAEAMTGGSSDTVTVGGESRHVTGYMKDFLFRPEQARAPVGVLSGGERARLTLACAFARRSNLLVLDEPTNDLDLETLDLLQEKLAEYSGTVLLVSHDRAFLDRVVTSIIASGGNGNWVEYAGGYTDMLAQRAAAPPAVSPAKPGRVKQPRPVAQGGDSPVAPPRRMNFNDQRALELLPARIAALETQIAELNAILADPDLYARVRG